MVIGTGTGDSSSIRLRRDSWKVVQKETVNLNKKIHMQSLLIYPTRDDPLRLHEITRAQNYPSLESKSLREGR